jgi:hypothetical protein
MIANGSSLEAEKINFDSIRTVDGRDRTKTLSQANDGMNGTPPTTASKIVR